MGYDISDYRNIYKPYGTMEDFDNLLEAVHKHGMKLVQDLVVNHSSSEHQWFKESKADKASDKRDYYVWHAGKKGADGKREPPNNWRSVFGSEWRCLYMLLTGQLDPLGNGTRTRRSTTSTCSSTPSPTS